MPLHDWTNLPDWESVHQLWIVELFRWIKARLPVGFRAGLATVPGLTVGAPASHPDVNVRQHAPQPPAPEANAAAPWQPDTEVAVLALDPSMVVQVTQQGRLVAVVEVVSPRNKDRPETPLTSQDRYVGYLMHGVHLLLVDVHPQPLGFSFAEAIAAALGVAIERCPSPLAASYRVGGPADAGGRLLGIWQRPLTAGAPFPPLPLWLDQERSVTIDLEPTYARAAADAYLS
jgi:hypothetical protein